MSDQLRVAPEAIGKFRKLRWSEKDNRQTATLFVSIGFSVFSNVSMKNSSLYLEYLHCASLIFTNRFRYRTYLFYYYVRVIVNFYVLISAVENCFCGDYWFFNFFSSSVSLYLEGTFYCAWSRKTERHCK